MSVRKEKQKDLVFIPFRRHLFRFSKSAQLVYVRYSREAAFANYLELGHYYSP